MLGVGAHVTELMRTRVGNFKIEEAANIGELPQKASALHSVDAVLVHLPEMIVTGDDLEKARHGNPIPFSCCPNFTGWQDRRSVSRTATAGSLALEKLQRTLLK